MAGDYKIQKRIVRPSEPDSRRGGFTRQRVVWDVIAPNGAVVRTFRRKDWAYGEIRRRHDRARSLKEASAEARASGAPVVVKRRGSRAPITVSFIQDRSKT
jgi:hypothetical protein